MILISLGVEPIDEATDFKDRDASVLTSFLRNNEESLVDDVCMMAVMLELPMKRHCRTDVASGGYLPCYCWQVVEEESLSDLQLCKCKSRRMEI